MVTSDLLTADQARAMTPSYNDIKLKEILDYIKAVAKTGRSRFVAKIVPNISKADYRIVTLKLRELGYEVVIFECKDRLPPAWYQLEIRW